MNTHFIKRWLLHVSNVVNRGKQEGKGRQLWLPQRSPCLSVCSAIFNQHLLMRFQVLRAELPISKDNANTGIVIASVTSVYCTQIEGDN